MPHRRAGYRPRRGRGEPCAATSAGPRLPRMDRGRPRSLTFIAPLRGPPGRPRAGTSRMRHRGDSVPAHDHRSRHRATAPARPPHAWHRTVAPRPDRPPPGDLRPALEPASRVLAAHNGPMPLLTVGHGTLDRAQLGELLAGGGMAGVVAERRDPGRRRHPDMAREALADWLPEFKVAYRWEERLGGRRHLRKADGESPDSWWQVDAFRAYAAHTRTEEFRDALAEVIEESRDRRVGVMCSESVWWRCHRRLIADVVALTTQVRVGHLMHNGTVRPHRPAEGARRDGDVLIWDGSPS